MLTYCFSKSLKIANTHYLRIKCVLQAHHENNAYCVRIKGVLLSQRITKYAPVAQLDRVTDSDSVGRWFESSRAYHEKRQASQDACRFSFCPDGRTLSASAPHRLFTRVGVPSRFMRKIVCRLRLSEVSRQ